MSKVKFRVLAGEVKFCGSEHHRQPAFLQLLILSISPNSTSLLIESEKAKLFRPTFFLQYPAAMGKNYYVATNLINALNYK